MRIKSNHESEKFDITPSLMLVLGITLLILNCFADEQPLYSDISGFVVLQSIVFFL